jgi:hypothetical protein
MDLRKQIIEASAHHFEAHVNRHRLNIEVMLSNPMAIHEHTDLMSAIEQELAHIAEYEDKLEALNKYF